MRLPTSVRVAALAVAVLLSFAQEARAAQTAAQPPGECVTLDIHEIGPERLLRIRAVPELGVRLEIDDEFLACGRKEPLAALEELATVRRRLGRLDPSRLSLAYRLGRSELERQGFTVLASGGLFAVVESPQPLSPAERPSGLLPFRPDMVLARQLANQPFRAARQEGAGTVAGLVDEVDAERWFADVEGLAAFNRYSLGSGIEEARQWLVEEFRRIPGLKVRSRSFDLGGSRVANVIAKLRGTSRRRHLFIVGGHYDSTSDVPMTAAPGAEDNASDCAGVLEMARIFAANPPDATILFICYAGEEQGLYGAIDHALDLVQSTKDDKVGAMLNLDMIGFTEDEDLDCLLQSSVEWQFLIDALANAAVAHTDLRIVTALALGGSDHVPYAEFGMPAVLSIENDWNSYPHYHRTTDTPDKLTPEMAAEILRMNVGALARMTGISDASGCVTLDDASLADLRVTSIQPGEQRQVTRTDRLGCFAVDPLAREKKFKLRIKSSSELEASGSLSGCLRLLGAGADNRRVVLRQPGEAMQSASSDEDGCFEFQAVEGTVFKLVFKGPKVPAGEAD